MVKKTSMMECDEETVLALDLLQVGVPKARVIEMFRGRIDPHILDKLSRTSTKHHTGNNQPRDIYTSRTNQQQRNKNTHHYNGNRHRHRKQKREEVDPSIRRLVDEMKAPDQFLDPLYKHLMKDPVVLSSGHVFDRSSVVDSKNKLMFQRCPVSRKHLSNSVITLASKKREIEHYKIKRKRNVADIAKKLIASGNYDSFHLVLEIKQYCRDLGINYMPLVKELVVMWTGVNQYNEDSLLPVRAEHSKVFDYRSGNDAKRPHPIYGKNDRFITNSELRRIDGKSEEDESSYSNHGQLMVGAHRGRKTRTKIFLESSTNQELIMLRSVFRNTFCIMLLVENIKPQEQHASTNGQTLVSSESLQDKVFRIIVSAEHFQGGQSSRRHDDWGGIYLCLCNEDGLVVESSKIFDHRGGTDGKLHQVFRKRDRIVKESKPGYNYQLKVMSSSNGRMVDVQGLMCKIFPQSCRKPSYRMESAEGEPGIFLGSVDMIMKNQAHGPGVLDYDDGKRFVGSFHRGSISEGVLYRGAEVVHTVRRGKQEKLVDEVLVQKYVVNMLVKVAEDNPPPNEHVHHNKSVRPYVDMDKGFNNNDYQFLGGTRFRKEFDDASTSELVAKDYSVYDRHISDRKEDSVGPRNNLHQSEMLSSTFKSGEGGNSELRRIDGKSEEDESSYSNHGQLMVGAHRGRKTRTKIFLESSTNQELIMLRSVFRNTFCIMLLVENIKPQEQHASTNGQTLVSSESLQDKVFRIIVSAEHFQGGQSSRRHDDWGGIYLCLCNEDGLVVESSKIFDHRGGTDGKLHQVFRKRDRIVKESKPGYNYQLKVMSSSNGRMVDVQGLMCKIFPQSCRKPSYRMESAEGEPGIFLGSVDMIMKNQAHGPGVLDYDDGKRFVGSFHRGSISEGVLYRGAEVVHTVRRGKQEKLVDEVLVQKYVVNMLVKVAEDNPPPNEHVHHNKSVRPYVDMDKGFNNNDYQFLGGTRFRKEFDDASTSELVAKDYSVYDRHISDRKEDSVGPRNNLHQSEMLSSTFKSGEGGINRIRVEHHRDSLEGFVYDSDIVSQPMNNPLHSRRGIEGSHFDDDERDVTRSVKMNSSVGGNDEIHSKFDHAFISGQRKHDRISKSSDAAVLLTSTNKGSSSSNRSSIRVEHHRDSLERFVYDSDIVSQPMNNRLHSREIEGSHFDDDERDVTRSVKMDSSVGGNDEIHSQFDHAFISAGQKKHDRISKSSDAAVLLTSTNKGSSSSNRSSSRKVIIVAGVESDEVSLDSKQADELTIDSTISNIVRDDQLLNSSLGFKDKRRSSQSVGSRSTTSRRNEDDCSSYDESSDYYSSATRRGDGFCNMMHACFNWCEHPPPFFDMMHDFLSWCEHSPPTIVDNCLCDTEFNKRECIDFKNWLIQNQTSAITNASSWTTGDGTRNSEVITPDSSYHDNADCVDDCARAFEVKSAFPQNEKSIPPRVASTTILDKNHVGISIPVLQSSNTKHIEDTTLTNRHIIRSLSEPSLCSGTLSSARLTKNLEGLKNEDDNLLSDGLLPPAADKKEADLSCPGHDAVVGEQIKSSVGLRDESNKRHSHSIGFADIGRKDSQFSSHSSIITTSKKKDAVELVDSKITESFLDDRKDTDFIPQSLLSTNKKVGGKHLLSSSPRRSSSEPLLCSKDTLSAELNHTSIASFRHQGNPTLYSLIDLKRSNESVEVSLDSYLMRGDQMINPFDSRNQNFTHFDGPIPDGRNDDEALPLDLMTAKNNEADEHISDISLLTRSRSEPLLCRDALSVGPNNDPFDPFCLNEEGKQRLNSLTTTSKVDLSISRGVMKGDQQITDISALEAEILSRTDRSVSDDKRDEDDLAFSSGAKISIAPQNPSGLRNKINILSEELPYTDSGVNDIEVVKDHQFSERSDDSERKEESQQPISLNSHQEGVLMVREEGRSGDDTRDDTGIVRFRSTANKNILLASPMLQTVRQHHTECERLKQRLLERSAVWAETWLQDSKQGVHQYVERKFQGRISVRDCSSNEELSTRYTNI